MGRIASYAGITFEVSEEKALSFQNMTIQRGINYEEHPRAKDHPFMEFTSKQNATMQLEVIAKASLGVNPRDMWNQFAAIRDEHKAAYFFLGVAKTEHQKKVAKKLGSPGMRRVGRERWVITDITNTFKAFNVLGTPTDMTFDITLKEYPYKKAKSEKASNSKKKKKAKSTTPAKKNYVIYTVKGGDCLWNLALKYYGKGNKYTKIFNANKDGKDGTHKLTNPNVLQAGWKIKIPK